MPQANIPQGKFLQMPHKYKAFVAGYGSGKTWVGCMAMCMNAFKFPGVTQGYFAPTYSHIRDIFYPTLGEVADTFGLHVEILKSDKEVYVYDRRRLLCKIIARSMDRPELIVGFKIGHALVDELDTLATNKARDAWRKILARLRWLGARNSVDVTTTPEGYRFTYDMFVDAVRKKPALKDMYGLIQASTYDNAANLNEDYIPSLVASYPAALIDAYLRGQFVNLTTGTVYCYLPARHRSTETIQPGELLCVGMDFNVTKMAAVVYVIRDKVWHAVDELKNLFDTPAMVDALKARFPGHKIRVYPDASGKNRKSVNASTSDIALLEAAGFAVWAPNANPAVKDRVLAMNVALERGLVYVNDDKCPEFSKCLAQQAYDDNGEPEKKTGLDHMNDAGTYPIHFTMPVVKPAIKARTIYADKYKE